MINKKAQFACDILKQSADENGTFPRTTSDLSPLEQWLIVRLFNAPCSECNGTGRWKDDECDPEIDCPKCKAKKPCVHPFASVTGDDNGNPYCLQCETKLYTT